MNNHARLVITGIGTLSAGGADLGSLWKSALTGRVNVKPHHLANLDRVISVYAVDEMPVFSARDRRLIRHADRSVHLALAAAREAWRDAGLPEKLANPDRGGLVIGSSRGPVGIASQTDHASAKKPTDSIYTAFSSISGIMASAFQLQGCAQMTSATCISGAVALKTGMQLISSGELDLVLVGGVDAPLLDSLLEQFAATDVLARETGLTALRPFDRHRTGTALGEGAAFLVLESEASALRRGVPIRGIVHQVGINCDSGFRTGGDKSGEGLLRTVERTLNACGSQSPPIDLIHLHGTGTLLNDTMESQCVHRFFGPETRQPWAWATKAITGHTLGASALFQIALTLKALHHQFIPGTINCLEQDPHCPIRLSRSEGVHADLQTALCLTSGFWGNTSCVVLGRP